ncbi:MAG: hypothetical protein QOJ64_1197 [Acidobacteriota bacterium]|nr:hypothetical protein [Acidobacteriota bacterium]
MRHQRRGGSYDAGFCVAEHTQVRWRLQAFFMRLVKNLPLERHYRVVPKEMSRSHLVLIYLHLLAILIHRDVDDFGVGNAHAFTRTSIALRLYNHADRN